MPEEERKTLADLAHSCADAEGPRSPNHEKPHKSLAEAAMEYQEHLSPPNSQPAKVAVVTGEEEEKNVLQVSTFINFRLAKPQNALSYQSRFSPCTIITDGELRSVFCVSVFQGSLLVIVIMIDGGEKRNCEGGPPHGGASRWHLNFRVRVFVKSRIMG